MATSKLHKTTSNRTYLAFHHDGHLTTLKTTITAITPFAKLSEVNRQLFKQATSPPVDDFVLVTAHTIFHPQGGGQPSDVGSITSVANPNSIFHVSAARMDTEAAGQVLHLGHFSTGPDRAAAGFSEGAEVEQAIDAEKRALFSRLHTAGHVLGAAVRHLVEAEIPGFDELKASHFPGQASCEFVGAIGGEWKGRIQERAARYVDDDMPVEIEWWDERDFEREGLARLLVPREVLGMQEGEKYRVVRIRGAEVYPCGGTHVNSTAECKGLTVKKISRSKGVSRVSYTVD